MAALGPLGGATDITGEISQTTGTMRVRATLHYLDGTQAPLDVTIEPHKVALLQGVAADLKPDFLVDAEAGPGPADVARILAAFYNVMQCPAPPHAHPAPIVVSPPDLSFG